MAADFVGREAFGKVDFVRVADVVSRAEVSSLRSALPKASLSTDPPAAGLPADKVGRHFKHGRHFISAVTAPELPGHRHRLYDPTLLSQQTTSGETDDFDTA